MGGGIWSAVSDPAALVGLPDPSVSASSTCGKRAPSLGTFVPPSINASLPRESSIANERTVILLGVDADPGLAPLRSLVDGFLVIWNRPRCTVDGEGVEAIARAWALRINQASLAARASKPDRGNALRRGSEI